MEQFNSDKYPFQEETYKIIGLAMEVHKTLGRGFAEVVYKDALEYEFKLNGIFYEREKLLKVAYKDTILPHKFNADFVVAGNVILEAKCKKGIIEDHYSQVINYLTISKLTVGLIVNFHPKSLEFKRVVKTDE